MSLLDATYFDQADCNIPQGTYNTVTDHLTRYERDILIQVLGYDLYKLVADYNVSTSPQRIKDIVEGKEYTEGSYTVKWNGLTNSEKVSPLAFAIYAEWLKSTLIISNSGAGSANAENSTNIGIGSEVQRATSKARELFGYVDNDMYAPTLYNFLMKHQTTYTEWIFNEFKMINVFGL